VSGKLAGSSPLGHRDHPVFGGSHLADYAKGLPTRLRDLGGTTMAENRGVKAEEIIALSKKEGFLAKQLYVVFTTPTNGIGPVMKNVKEHLAFQVRLEKEGIMFAAGPNWTDDEKSWDGDGMVVIRANSLADAKKIMERDPMHKSGARKFKIRPWFVNEGTVSIRLNYSQGTFEMI
jgi:uncharacterized protein YciI